VIRKISKNWNILNPNIIFWLYCESASNFLCIHFCWKRAA